MDEIDLANAIVHRWMKCDHDSNVLDEISP
jgi:hypothetical protein